MSEESPDEIPENRQELDVSESESCLDDPAFAAMVKRYGFTPQQAREAMLYL